MKLMTRALHVVVGLTLFQGAQAIPVVTDGAWLSVEGDWSGPVRRQTGDGEIESWEGRDLALRARELDGRRTNPDADFVAAVLDGTAADPDFATALRAHELADAAYRSAANDGIPVTR